VSAYLVSQVLGGLVRKCVSCIALLAVPFVASAGFQIGGDQIRVAYWDEGTWNWGDSSTGLQIYNSYYDWQDVSFPGTPWQATTFRYEIGDHTYGYLGNYADLSASWVTDAEANLSADGKQWAWHQWTGDYVVIEKDEIFLDDAQSMLLLFTVLNAGKHDIDEFVLMHAVDPDQDYDTFGYTDTINDVEDRDSDGMNDWVEARGPSSDWTVGYGICDPMAQDVGSTDWSDSPLAPFWDSNGAELDETIHIRHTQGTLAAGDTLQFGFFFTWGETEAQAENNYEDYGPYLCALDFDADDSVDAYWGGDDCDDADETVFPGAAEIWYDGLDQDCKEDDDYDADADGYRSEEYEGSDCDDEDATIFPGAADTWYDGVDSDCDEADDYDQDGDGYASDEHDGTDCDDTSASAYPGATDTWYDGIDSDCDEADDYDKDGDGFASDEHGGTDCDDSDTTVNPGASDGFYDGVDSDCDGESDYDFDGDGYDASAFGGEDCDDTDAGVSPAAEEIADDGVDQDCDGSDTVSSSTENDDTGDSSNDTGDSSDDTGAGKTLLVEGDCGCSASGQRPVGVVWLASLLGLAVGRRRRVS
jgi:MYXO-CTERM domain-containing protein